MIHLAHEIGYCRVPKGKTAVFWLGQAGYIIKNSEGCLLAVDLYLSDCVSRYDGFRRLIPELVDPADLDLDVLIATHSHLDHFDIDAMPYLFKEKTQLVAAEDCREFCNRLSFDSSRTNFLRPGRHIQMCGFNIEAVQCDHGTLAPDAIGLLVTVSGKRIYITGDTAFRSDIFSSSRIHGVDLLICPINGAFGNMNEKEAAEAARIIMPERVIPCHYWNFAEHGGDPGVFISQMKQIAPDIDYYVMHMGEKIEI